MRLLLVALLVLAVPVQADHVSPGEIRWACGFNGSEQRGHPSGCGIDPVGGDGVDSEGEPRWGDAWVDDDEPILGLVIDGDARAVPVVMLDSHEIVNAEIQGRSIAITYCPLCGSGVAFDRVVHLGGATQTLDFAASGFLYQNDLVMWDSQTGTLWNQITGTAIGTLVDERVQADHEQAELDVVPLIVTSWGEWRSEHPGATMLQTVRSGYSNPYAGYETSDGRCGLGSCAGIDDALHPKELVIGIGEPSKAYPIFGVQAIGGVLIDSERDVVVTVTPGGAHAVYDLGGREFTLTDGAWTDAEGRVWDLDSGASGDERLAPVDALRLYWFAWSEHHSDTELWSPPAEALDEPGSPAPLERDNGKLLGFTIPIVAGLLLLGAILWRRSA